MAIVIKYTNLEIHFLSFIKKSRVPKFAQTLVPNSTTNKNLEYESLN